MDKATRSRAESGASTMRRGTPQPSASGSALQTNTDRPEVPDNRHVRASPVIPKSVTTSTSTATTSFTTTTSTTTSASATSTLEGSSSDDEAMEMVIAMEEWCTAILEQNRSVRLSGEHPLLEALLEAAGLPDHLAWLSIPEKEFGALPPDQLLSWFSQGINSQALDKDVPEELPLYLLYRLLGYNHQSAEKAAPYGPIYMLCRDDSDREVWFAHLGKRGISRSPLCFPKRRYALPDEGFQSLGKGSSNEVFKVNLGTEFAFKPASAAPKISPTTLHCGVRRETFFPFESHLIARSIAHGLTAEGAHCVIGFADVVEIDNNVGLLMELAAGKQNQLGSHQFQRRIGPNESDPAYRELYVRCSDHRQRLSDPLIYAAQCKLLGLTGISWEGQTLLVTGPVATTDYTLQPGLLDNPAFLEAMCLTQLVADLAGWCDSHTGNLFLQISPDGTEVDITMIDLDDACVVRSYQDMLLRAKTKAELRHYLYFLTPPVRWIGRAAAQLLLSESFQRKLDLTLGRVTGHYPQDRIDAIRTRFAQRKAAIESGAIQVIDTAEQWRAVDFGGPLDSFVGRARAILTKERFVRMHSGTTEV